MSKPLLDVLNKKHSPKTPIWLMRQAGRYLPEYMKIRANFADFIEFCLSPEAAAKVTLQPLERFDLDAAIIFSDILIVPHALGIDVKFEKGHGPVLSEYRGIGQISEINEEVFRSIGKSIKLTREKLGNDKTMIGFCGAPWTVASYMIEGKGSRDFDKVRRFAITRESDFAQLIDKLVEASIRYLQIQIENGAEVVKIFDSWAGVLPPREQEKWVFQPISKIVESIKKSHPEIKIIGFPRKIGAGYKNFAEKVNVDCIALDQYTPMAWAKENLPGKILQGNLDNYLLLGDKETVRKEVLSILEITNSKDLIFNLGHGIMPDSKIENIETLIETVREYASSEGPKLSTG